MSGIEIVASEEDIRHFYITFDGPKGTLYEGGRYNLEMYVPPDYPKTPPKCLFITPIYHVNVNDIGKYTPLERCCARLCLAVVRSNLLEHP